MFEQNLASYVDSPIKIRMEKQRSKNFKRSNVNLLPNPWTSHLKCKICKNLYDADSHRPMILQECGHTICRMCTREMNDRLGKIVCPDDSTNMVIERVALNSTLLQMLKRICTVCEKIYGEELTEDKTEKKYFCSNCLDLLNKKKDEMKRKIWAKISVIQKKNSEAVEAIQNLVRMLENIKKEYLVHEKQRVEKCEFLRSMLENEDNLEEDEVKDYMDEVDKMNKEREKRKIDLKAIEHIKILIDQMFLSNDTEIFANFVQENQAILNATPPPPVSNPCHTPNCSHHQANSSSPQLPQPIPIRTVLRTGSNGTCGTVGNHTRRPRNPDFKVKECCLRNGAK